MWLMVASLPLLPAIVILYRCREQVRAAALLRRGVAWALRLLRRKTCVRSTHAFVFSTCTHGKANSVLETFDLYADTHASLCIGPEIGQVLDEAVRRTCPSRVLELGTHCGYTSVRLLRAMPPAGRLLTVELDPLTAELGEEVILVAGFKHTQFQVLTGSSGETIPKLHPFLEPDQGTGGGFTLVLMDHDPQQYLPDLLALEREALLCPSGCSIILITRSLRAGGLTETMSYVTARPGRFSVKTELHFMIEIFYQKKMYQ